MRFKAQAFWHLLYQMTLYDNSTPGFDIISSLLKAPIIAGSANNQLADEDLSSTLIRQQNILYCPDYVINAGGLINVYHEFIGYNVHKANQMLGNIYTNLLKIFEIAEDLCMSTQSAAQHFARTQRLSSQPWQNEHRRTAA
jgi:leucine dehydrogenase